MNLILFEKQFDFTRIEKIDTRALHIRKVLRAEVGALICVGFVNGPRGQAEVMELAEDGSVTLKLLSTEPALKSLPITLLIGLPRPHTAKRILFEAASLGVACVQFFEAERGEPSYANSRLWQNNAWRERLWRGAEQSFGTYLPEVVMYPDLQTALSELFVIPIRVALDNYEASRSLGASLSQDGQIGKDAKVCALAIGSERGWSPNERDCLRQNGWQIVHLGEPVLRVETAVVSAVAIATDRLGLHSN